MTKDTVDRLGDMITVFEPPVGPVALISLATRRLGQITTVLSLDPDYFEHAIQEEERALDSGNNQILSDQHRQITDALGEFIAPLARARAVALFVALAHKNAGSA